MTPNDSQIELLIRRQATRARGVSTTGEHLDADALNAFAEGALPAATRSLYVAHLADCDDCRKLVGELSIHAGSAAATQSAETRREPATSWWKSLAGLFALPAFKYAAVAIALIVVAGISFLAWRRSNPSGRNLIVQNQPAANPESTTANNATASPVAGTDSNPPVDRSAIAKALPQPTIGNGRETLGEAPAAPPPPAKPRTEIAVNEPEPVITANKPVVAARAEATPSFAPQPAESNESRAREQQNVAGIIHGGPRRSESNEKYKVLDRNRSTDVAKEEDRLRGIADVDEKKSDKSAPKQSQSGTLSMSAGAARDDRAEARKSNDVTTVSSTTTASIRSVGGRKFQRSGNAWVDVKFKSTMAIRNVSRGSDEFDALDSKLKSIAQQLGGEVIVVWKGKAYKIK